MPVVSCDSVREVILKHLSELTRVEQARDLCIATLPVRTLDGRLVDVFIEQRIGDYVRVHDADKAANELILQGVNITSSISGNCERIAQSFGVAWSDEMFQSNCKIEKISSAALSVAMCSSLAMVHLLGHVEEPEQETVREQLGVALKGWNRRRAKIKSNVRIEGAWKQHSFDFVAFPKMVWSQ